MLFRSQPTVQRLDVTEPGQALAAVEAVGLDLSKAAHGERDDLLHLRTRGIPTSPIGTLVLFVPQKKAPEDPLEVARFLPELAKLLRDTVQFPQTWQLALPAGTSATERDAITTAIRDYHPTPVATIEHQVGAPFTGNPWLLFVDSAGILRAAAEIGEPGIYSTVQRWARMYRNR